MYFLEARTRFIFDGIPVGTHVAKIVFERPALDTEHYYQINIRSASTEVGYVDIHCHPELMGEDGLPEFESKLEDKDGAAIASDIATSLLDTFDNSLIFETTGSINKLGFELAGEEILSRDKNFSLFKLIMCSDQQVFIDSGILIPMDDVSIAFYLDNDLKHKIVIERASINEEVLYVYGEKKEGEILVDNPYFFSYDARETRLAITGYDYNKWKLEQLSITDVLTAQNFANQNLHQYTNLMLWLTGDDTMGLVYPDDAAWNGAGVREMMIKSYNLAFSRTSHFDADKYKTPAPENFDRSGNYWNYQVDDSLARYVCSKIPESSFLTLGSAYAPYLKKRHYEIAGATHKRTDNFNLLDTDKEEIWIHESFLREYNFTWPRIPQAHQFRNHPTEGINDKEYCFTRYENLFQACTRVANSHFYYSRYAYKHGVPFVQHLFKKRRPPLVKIPANLQGGQHVEPYATYNRFVEGQPYAKFGKQLPYRLVESGGNGDYHNNTAEHHWSQYAELHEPANDQSRFLLKWREDQWGYYHWEDVEYTENRKRYEKDVQPFVQGSQPLDSEKIYITKSYYGLFGSLCVCVIGCNFDGDSPEHDGFIFEALISNPFGVDDTEFCWYVIGTNAEYILVQWDLGISTEYPFSSGYPGLILLAGGSNDNGKTIDKDVAGEYYRGCVQIELPWGDPDEDGNYTYKKSVGALQAHAMYLSQIKIGSDGRMTLELPTLDNYENELGETGYDAIYEGLGIELYGQIWLIERIEKLWKEDKIIVDVIPIPPEEILPEISDYDIPVFSNGCGSYRKFGAEYVRMTDSAQVFENPYNKRINGACS
jgi:hypothetical protein